ncbi:MAG: energy transducer TonB [Verrucomicrobiota bacterium]
MHRWTDLLTSFGMSLLLHGLLVLGMIWFWTVRTPNLQPMFQGGDVSLAVTFVVETEAEAHPAVAAKSEEQVRAQTQDEAAKPVSVKDEDQDMLDVETAEMVFTQASAKAPEDERPKTNPTTGASSDAFRQGVSGALRMQSEIRPYYPLGARLRGEEGAVTLRVWVKPSGCASRCEVVHSSGYPALDEAAMDAAQRACYVSTRPGIWRAEAEMTLTFRFRLTE